METSDELIKELVSHVDAGSYCLEPSAGRGKLARALIKLKDCRVDCVELNHYNIVYLKSFQDIHGYNNIYHDDFMQQYAKPVYDYVVAVPPYKENIDCLHIMQMYAHLKLGGKVVTLTHPAWVTGFFEVQRKFRNWLNCTKSFKVKFIEDESYMSCPKMLLVIEK